MKIEKELENNKLTIKVSGKLDVESAHKLESEINENVDGIKELELNFKDLEYISSAGIRAVFILNKLMEKQGKMIVTNVGSFVMNVFETTGVNKLLNIQ